MQNAFVESFNGKLRAECLNQHWFLGLNEARERIEAWHRSYNRERPHSALGYLAPHTYLQTWTKQPTAVSSVIVNVTRCILVDADFR
jgi:putative transposase